MTDFGETGGISRGFAVCFFMDMNGLAMPPDSAQKSKEKTAKD
ncbi:hypothetical protein [Butyricicoccus sp.]